MTARQLTIESFELRFQEGCRVILRAFADEEFTLCAMEDDVLTALGRYTDLGEARAAAWAYLHGRDEWSVVAAAHPLSPTGGVELPAA